MWPPASPVEASSNNIKSVRYRQIQHNPLQTGGYGRACTNVNCINWREKERRSLQIETGLNRLFLCGLAEGRQTDVQELHGLVFRHVRGKAQWLLYADDTGLVGV